MCGVVDGVQIRKCYEVKILWRSIWRPANVFFSMNFLGGDQREVFEMW